MKGMAKGLSERQSRILKILDASAKELSGQELHQLMQGRAQVAQVSRQAHRWPPYAAAPAAA